MAREPVQIPINSHKYVISAYNDYLENNPVRQHPTVSALMTGVFNANPQ